MGQGSRWWFGGHGRSPVPPTHGGGSIPDHVPTASPMEAGQAPARPCPWGTATSPTAFRRDTLTLGSTSWASHSSHHRSAPQVGPSDQTYPHSHTLPAPCRGRLWGTGHPMAGFPSGRDPWDQPGMLPYTMVLGDSRGDPGMLPHGQGLVSVLGIPSIPLRAHQSLGQLHRG